MLEAFPGAAKVADDEGYLPLHLALDCARPNPVIARMLLDHYPESAFHKSKDGLLPIHCIISSLNPVIEVIELLLQIFPDSTESMAVDVIPVDETADPELWEGEWVEKRWTPLSRAIDRGLDSIVMLFRDALNTGKHAAAQREQQQNNSRMPGNAATTKNLMPQSQPPINSHLTEAPFMQNSPAGGGPSTSSNEGNRGRGHPAQGGLVLGGVLDSPYDDEGVDEGAAQHMRQNMLSTAASAHQRSQQHLHHAASMPNQQHAQVPLRERAPGGMTRGPSMHGPQGHTPHGHSTPNMNLADLKIRDRDHRDRDRGHDRDGRDARDRDRDRDRDPKRRSHRPRDDRGRSSSRPRDYYEDDYPPEEATPGNSRDPRDRDPRDRDRDRERSDKYRSSSRNRGRSSSRNHRDRSSSRDPNRESRGKLIFPYI